MIYSERFLNWSTGKEMKSELDKIRALSADQQNVIQMNMSNQTEVRFKQNIFLELNKIFFRLTCSTSHQETQETAQDIHEETSKQFL